MNRWWPYRWRIFNLLSIIAGMLGCGILLGMIMSMVQAPSWANFLVGLLLGRVTVRLIRDQIL
jgi:xanthosine utilization system XapX-like protein